MRDRITTMFGQRLKVVLLLIVFQVGLTLALVAWWGVLLTEQAQRIDELTLGSQDLLNKTRRMVAFEGVWFAVVVIVAAVFFVSLYYRDLKRSRALQSFFASLTHELKTPLTSIRLQAEAIADVPLDDDYASELVKRLLQDTARLETQVQRALELARIEGGGKLHAQPLRLKSILEKSAAEWEFTDAGRLQLAIELGDDVVVADKAALLIVVKNLIENSLRHGGQSSIKIQMRSEVVGDELRIIYKDNGQGSKLSATELGKLFVRGPDSSGAGVGLYLVCELMRKMGGRTEFKDDDGFTVELYLPLARGRES